MTERKKDYYCECGQFLNTYFEVIGKCSVVGDAQWLGLPCPAKGCKKTFTMEKKANIQDPMEPRISVLVTTGNDPS